MAGGRPFSACGLQPNQGVLTGGVGPFLARRGLAAVRRGWRWGGWLTIGKRAAGWAGVKTCCGGIVGLRPDAPGRLWVCWAAGGRALQLKYQGWVSRANGAKSAEQGAADAAELSRAGAGGLR